MGKKKTQNAGKYIGWRNRKININLFFFLHVPPTSHAKENEPVDSEWCLIGYFGD